MNAAWVWKGDGFRASDAVPIADRGFRYGMSLFESFPVRNGKPIFLDAHLRRLSEACARCEFQVDPAALGACAEVLGGCEQDGFARIYVTGGDGSVSGGFDDCRVYLFLEERAPIPSRVFHRGYDLGFADQPTVPLFDGLKTGNYWANLDAFRRGIARQKNETLLFNVRGELISACMANLFLVSAAGALQTPILASGARNGVIREWVLSRRRVEECPLTRRDVEAAPGMFLTSSWLGIMPVASVEGRILAASAVATELRREYVDSL